MGCVSKCVWGGRVGVGAEQVQIDIEGQNK